MTTLARYAGTETVLLVDDDPAVRRLAQRILSTHGYAVLTASDAASALLLAERYRGTIDMLVTDVLMPGQDGHELAGSLPHLRPALKVLYISGAYQQAFIRDGAVVSAPPFVPKPFTAETLLRAVRTVLDTGRPPRSRPVEPALDETTESDSALAGEPIGGAESSDPSRVDA